MPLRSFSQAEMLLTERRRLERPLLGMIWLGILGFSLADPRNGWFYFLASTFAVAVNMYAVHRAKEVYVKRLFVNIGVLFATGILFVEFLASHEILLRVLGHYLILIQLCKLFERKRNRDYVQMLALSLLLMVAAALIATSLWFAVVFAAHLTLACHATMVLTLKRGLDAAAEARLATEPGPLAPQRVAWNVSRDWPGRALRRQLIGVLATLLTAGVVVFLLAPRGAGGTSAMLKEIGRNPTSGFSGRVRLGDEAGKVYLSNEVVMHVAVELPEADGGVPASATYLRGRTHDSYAGSQWGQLPESHGHRATVPRMPDVLRKQATVQRVWMAPSLLPTLFTGYPVLDVEVDSRLGRPAIGPDMAVKMSSGRRAEGLFRYTAYCWSPPLSLRQRWFLMEWRSHFKTPSLHPQQHIETTPQVRRLAQEWCADLVVLRDAAGGAGRIAERDEYDLEIARRIAEGLRRRCSYSLDLSDADPARDGVDDFLFRTRRGHCEYFASALTVMCRVLGVRARLVTGFRMHEYDPGAGRFVVRNRDAHAWTEVFTPSTDWTIEDATPAARFEQDEGGWWARVTGSWEDVEFLWYQKVIGYNNAARRAIAERLQDWAGALWSGLSAAALAVRDLAWRLLVRGTLNEYLIRFSVLLGLVGLTVGGILLVRSARRALAVRRAGPAATAWRTSQLKFVRRLLALLQRKGLAASPDRTVREAADEATARLDLSPDALGGLVDLYYAMRWGYAPRDGRRLRDAEREVRRLRRALR